MEEAKLRNRTKDELLHAIEELEEANQSKNAFIANISHEVRTPMNAILGFSELILQLDESEKVNEYAKEIKSASNNLLAIINDLLDISKIESGRMELVPVPYYLHYLFTDIESVMSIPAGKKGIEFRLKVNPELPSQLYGDIVRIRQVLTNLCNNAVKFTNEGYVELSATYTQGCGKEIFEKKYGHDPLVSLEDVITIEFRVKDSGIGIREEDLELIFDKFRQVDMRTNRNVEGSGLGLAICKQLVELMSGELSVESTYGEGTTFIVKIPQKVIDGNKLSNYLATHKQEEQKKKTYLYAPGARLLVVDDNPVNVKILKGLLIHYEIDADTALSGQEAVDKVKEHEYDMIFMDHMMPQMSGDEALDIIRRIPGREKSVVVAVTANAIRGMRDEFIKMGFDDYLSKPVETSKIEEILKAHLPSNLFIHGEKEDNKEQIELNVVIDGVDIDAGLIKSDNNVRDYVDILEIFTEYGPEKAKELESLVRAQDYTGYTIAVHSLKSVAANIGANQLCAMAQIHEMAGKQGQSAFIDQNYIKLKSMYETIVSNIEVALSQIKSSLE